MTGKKLWWILGAGLAAAAAGTGTTIAVISATGPGKLVHDPAVAATPPQQLITAVTSAPADESANAELAATLDTLAHNPALGTFGAQVTDTSTGKVVWSRNPTTPLTPASTTKILTAAAALLALGPDDRITTAIVPGSSPDTVVVRAAGDVMLTEEQLDDLVAQVKKNHPHQVEKVLVDVSLWSGPAFLDSWEREDIAAGFIAPMEPVMLYGARMGEHSGDVPRSTTPAADVGAALAARLGAGVSEVSVEQVPGQQDKPVASVESDTLRERLRQMMLDSDNVVAEAVGRELAVERGLPGTNASAVAATLGVLNERGYATVGVQLLDNSGMSVGNMIAPALLDEIVQHAVTEQQLRPLLETLPVAAGSGTLVDRYQGQAGAGWVRGKTGTLTKTTGLAGTVLSVDGRVYTYGFLANDADVLASRAAMDAMTSAIRG